jgi:hypothetical protein
MYIVLPIIVTLITVLSITYLLVRKNINEMQRILEAIFNIDEQLANINAHVEDAKKRQNILLCKRDELQEIPNTWSASTGILIEIFSEDDQYWSVARELQKAWKTHGSRSCGACKISRCGPITPSTKTGW